MTPTVGERFADLLDRSAGQQAHGDFDEAVFHRILDQLSPDAASLLVQFLDGQPRAAVQVLSKTRFGDEEFAVASLAGRASLGQPQLAQAYLGHLVAMRLLQVGPDLGDDQGYRLMECEIALRAAKREVRELIGNATLRRCSIGLTPLGRAFLAEATDS